MSSKMIAVLYGSETGNAYDFASILSHKLHRLHFAHHFSSIGDYNSSDILSCRYLFIICSTTGQGELPRNAHECSIAGRNGPTFWDFLRKKQLPKDFLDHVSVGLLGLGDSSYPHFNYAIRKLHQRLVTQLGATESFDRLEADEISMAGSNKGTGLGTESVYFEFEKKVFALLTSAFPTRTIGDEIVKRVPMRDDVYLQPPTYLVEKKNSIDIEPELDNSLLKHGIVIKNDRITHQDHFQDVRQFVFKSQESHDYDPGDTISIHPHNTDENVEKLLNNQPHWISVADRPLSFTDGAPANLNNMGLLGKSLTLRKLLKYYCDFMSIPKVSFFMKVWFFAVDLSRMDEGQKQLDQQRDKLRQFGTDEDMQDLFDYCNRPRRSILEVLEDFPSLNLPWEYVLDYMPAIKPRFYSISSGSSNPEIELTVAIVKYKTMLARIREGLCTQFISDLKPGTEFSYRIQNNNLLKRTNFKNPMILVSPGVGIAPMLSIIRSELSRNLLLFSGNRIKRYDFLYGDSLEKWNEEGIIELFTCFSRDPENSTGVKYVQDVLWKKGEALTDLIVNQNASIYLCGSSGKMPVQVRVTILEMLKKWGNFENEVSAQHYLKAMEKTYRYLQETW